MKKSISLLLSIVLILMTFTPSLADAQDDLYIQAGEILGNAKVLQGNANGDLMLNNYLQRQDMVVLVSRLFKEESIARNGSSKIPFKDVTNSFYKPYISWSVNKGLIVGKTETKFGFKETVTVQQLQTVLLRALGYNEEAKDWANVPTFASGLGIMDNIDAKPNDTVMRGLMAAMTVNALKINKKGTSTTLANFLNISIPDPFKVTSVPTVNKDTLKIEGMATGAKKLQLHLKPKSINTKDKFIDVSLQDDGRFIVEVKDLESGDYSFAFTNGTYYTEYENFTIKELPLELISVKADNLKEIKLTFSKPVDKATALFTSNYYTDAGTIKKVRLEDEDKQVILTLDSTMTNQKKYNLSISKIKSVNGEELSLSKLDFTTVDNSIPKVVEIEQLGNKIIKVYFSEPIKPAINSNFLYDGKTFFGSIRNEDNVVYLNFYTSLSNGKHTLTTSYIEDYAGYKSVVETTSFEIKEDKEAPKLIGARATIEEVILTFSKDIDPTNVQRTDFYWKSGRSKVYPTEIKVVNNEIVLDYSKDNLSANRKETIYVDWVSDYSGNTLKYVDIDVTPTLDLSAPEVVNVRLSADGKEINVSYNKNVIANNRNFYNIIDKDKRPVAIKEITGSGKEYKIVLFQTLPVGRNTLEIEGVYDTTSLRNAMYPYSKTIDMKDSTLPKVISHSGVDSQIILQFNKVMDLSTLMDKKNYLITYYNAVTYLPDDVRFDTLNDGKTLIINLPDSIDGKRVDIGSNLTNLQLRDLKDLSNNVIMPVTLEFSHSNTGVAKAIDFYETNPGYQGVFLENNKIKIRFNQPILEASTRDFYIQNRTIQDVIVDGTDVVTLVLDNKNLTTPPSKVEIEYRNKIKTIISGYVDDGAIKILDKVSPRVEDIYNLKTYNEIIELPFTEALQSDGEALYKRDLIIRDPNGNIIPENDYTTSVYNSNILEIKIKNPKRGNYTIMLKDDIKYIEDLSGNRAESSGEMFNVSIY